MLALQIADARLARLDRPANLPLRKALARDLERLNALPFVDMPGISLRLEQLILGVDKLPLTAYGRPVDKAESQKPAARSSWWQSAAGDVRQELKGLVRIQRRPRRSGAAGARPGLLPARELQAAPAQCPSGADRARPRDLPQRIRRLPRNGWEHFDTNDKAVAAAQSTLRQMTASEINVELPNLNETQAALRNLRQTKEKR